MLRPLLPKNTQRKVHIHGAGAAQSLTEEVRPDFLPEQLGGRAACRELRPPVLRSTTAASWGHRLCGNQPVRRVSTKSFLGDDALGRAVRNHTATPSSRRRVDGVEDDATIQHERAVKF